MCQNIVQKCHIGFQATNTELGQCPAHLSATTVQRTASGGHLDEHGVKKWGYGNALIDTARIETDAETGGTPIGRYHAIIGLKIVAGSSVVIRHCKATSVTCTDS